jgi:uncharacterized membrane protein YphA (DoxX/SURF4 family)
LELPEDKALGVQNSTKRITVKSAIGLLLLLSLSATFFYSGYSKIHSDNAIDQFQWSFFDMGIKSQLVTGIIARLMIGFEFVLGTFLLFHIFLHQFTYRAILGTLAVFSIYIVWILVKQGDAGDCGCFGDKLALKPSASLVKNGIMAAATVVLMFIYKVRPYKNQDMLSIISGMLALTIPFLVNPVNISSKPVKFTKPMNLEMLYRVEPTPSVDLRKGKHIVAFMTLTCPHCKKAAYLLQIIHREHPEIPVYMVLSGEPKEKDAFFKETHAESVPHFLFYDWGAFAALTGEEGYPAIYWLNNGKIELRSQMTYYQLDPKYMTQWSKGE